MWSTLYDRRVWFSRAMAASIVALALSPLLKYHPRPAPPPVEDLLAITMVAVPDEPAPPPPPKPVEHKVVPATQPTVAPRVVVPDIQATPSTPTPNAVVVPAEVQPPPAPAPVVASHPPETPPPPSPPPAPRAPSAEDEYLAKINAYVQARKKYPTSREASLLHPTGDVRAWVLLDRAGHVEDVGIERSSNSMILDGEALKLLRLASYPPFPDGSFAGAPKHRFFFDIRYSLHSD